MSAPRYTSDLSGLEIPLEVCELEDDVPVPAGRCVVVPSRTRLADLSRDSV